MKKLKIEEATKIIEDELSKNIDLDQPIDFAYGIISGWLAVKIIDKKAFEKLKNDFTDIV
jgi:hypothetical protein